MGRRGATLRVVPIDSARAPSAQDGAAVVGDLACALPKGRKYGHDLLCANGGMGCSTMLGRRLGGLFA